MKWQAGLIYQIALLVNQAMEEEECEPNNKLRATNDWILQINIIEYGKAR
jgi:hypothetical protein